MEKLELYAPMTYKNGENIQKCLKQNLVLTFTPRELDENVTTIQKEL